MDQIRLKDLAQCSLSESSMSYFDWVTVCIHYHTVHINLCLTLFGQIFHWTCCGSTMAPCQFLHHLLITRLDSGYLIF